MAYAKQTITKIKRRKVTFKKKSGKCPSCGRKK